MGTAKGIAELKVGGSYFGGWTSLSVTRSIEQIAGTFNLDMTERWPGSAELHKILPGQACQLYLDGQVVIDGYNDDVEPEYDRASHAVRVTGRDKTGDLVDCSAIHKSGQWHNVKLDVIARDLIKPFGIGLKVETDVGKAFPSWNIEEGESVFECLSRAARMRAVMLVSDAEGNLVIARAGSVQVEDALVEGKNILSASAKFSWKDRHSSYLIKGQNKGGDDWEGAAVAHPSASIADEVVSRYRPLVVVAEDHGSSGTLRDRAEWERNVRAGRASRATITVQGWTRVNGELWQPNTLVHVTSPMLMVDAPLLIAGCTYRLDERGTVTQIAVARREAFELFAGIKGSKLGKKLFDKEQKERKPKGSDWSML